MQYTTSVPLRATVHFLPRWLHVLAVLSFLALALLGRPPEVSAGWLVQPPVVYVSRSRRTGHGGWRRHRVQVQAACAYAQHTWRVPLARSAALGALWLASGRTGSAWVLVLPWAGWAWQVAGVLCPGLMGLPEWWLVRRLARGGERILLGAYLGLALRHWLVTLNQGGSPHGWPWGPEFGVLCARPSVRVRHDREGGRYAAELQGHLTLAVADDDPFRLRMLVLFLLLLEDPNGRRGSRRTRDGRTPFVRQQWLAEALGLCQPDISLWLRYWLQGDWRRLLSQHSREVLTLELQQRIIETWARWPNWGVEQVHRLLVQQGVTVTESQVRQAAQESGWQLVRRALGRLCVQQAETLRLREGWLVSDLLAQVQGLLAKLENREGLTPEEQLDLAAWRQATDEAGLLARPAERAQPWLQRLEPVLFRPEAEAQERRVQCPDCGSDHVGRKGLQPRYRRVVDEQGQLQRTPVYRYRCHNRACERESFTVLPPGLVPYTPHRLEVHVLALQMYAWGESTYRRTGRALGVASLTVYRWVSAFGYQLLPVAALFGVVRSSGVVGVDEKWVQVPKNNKPQGEHRKWMYVYFAVDAHTYDLLHIAIYPHNNKQSAQAFLWALRAKGYHPRAVITDLRQDYAPVIAEVFPEAQHHECLFHASQALHEQLAEIYGREATKTDAGIIALRRALDEPLQARTKRTAQRRYDELMAQREKYLQARQEAAPLFACLESHWPRLINGIESQLIPRTNNTVELVIRRFDQHYQNFCGFDSLETAHRFLGVFEKVYRFTPFSDDAQPRLRGRSPLQLAGYHVANLPMTALCSGSTLASPALTNQGGVPNL